MKNYKRIALACAAAAALVLGGYGIGYAQVVIYMGRPQDARFYLLGEDGLADPNRSAYVPATKLWLIKDSASEQCLLVLFAPGGPAMTSAACPVDPKGGAQ